MDQRNRNSAVVNMIAGGVGGTAGAIITCPLDVVQTRLQSSVVTRLKYANPILNTAVGQAGGPALINISSKRYGLQVMSYVLHIRKTEGFFSLYKGLVPNLFGILPSRAAYFAIYHKSKDILSNRTNLSYHSSWTHACSALVASWSVSTLTNPIWFIKTQLQLDMAESAKSRSIWAVVTEVWHNKGLPGFYRGLSASYVGAVETVMYFVIYERLKSYVTDDGKHSSVKSSLKYAFAAFIAKSIATTLSYPHEVARTRLRQESSGTNCQRKYSGLLQTVKKVWCEEGRVGLYGGMGAHLMRQVPNTVIMFVVFEYIHERLLNRE